MKERGLLAAAVAGAMAVGLGAPVSAHGAPHHAAHHASTTAKSPYLKVDAAKKTVTFTVLAGDGTANGGLDFDDTYNGQMTLTVPLNWTVDVVFKNVGGLPHSVLFETWSASLNSMSPTPVFKGAESPLPVDGTAPGGGAKFHFKATKAGKYRMICAFPGHAASGMWDVFVVSKTAKTASIKG